MPTVSRIRHRLGTLTALAVTGLILTIGHGIAIVITASGVLLTSQALVTQL